MHVHIASSNLERAQRMAEAVQAERPAETVTAHAAHEARSEARFEWLEEGKLIWLRDDSEGSRDGGAPAALLAESHGVVRDGSRPLSAQVHEVLAIVDETAVVVPLGERSYRVEIGQGIRSRVPARVRAVTEGAVVVVHDTQEGEARTWARDAVASLPGSIEVRLPRGEVHKSVATVERIWDTALEAGIDRSALVLGVGGGVVGDLTGFAASTLLRGVNLGQLPTTLLSMVDSSVGGKTGFNRAAGKNLVGSFYQPRFVLCDVETLDTLDAGERIAGLAEVVKSAWLDGENAVAGLEADAEALRAGDPAATIRAIEMSVTLKARIVRLDEREGGTRMLLNLGHTVGHGLEAAAGYRDLRHGDGVALGMVAALRVGVARGATTPDMAERLTRLLDAVGLPTDLDAKLTDEALDFVWADKKRRGDHIRFIVPGDPGHTTIAPMKPDEIRAAVKP